MPATTTTQSARSRSGSAGASRPGGTRVRGPAPAPAAGAPSSARPRRAAPVRGGPPDPRAGPACAGYVTRTVVTVGRQSWVGTPLPRLEDEALLRGLGGFI